MSTFTLSSTNTSRELLTAELAQKYVEPLTKAVEEKEPARFERLVISGKSFGRDAATIFGKAFSQLTGLTAVDMSDCIAQRLTDEVRDVLTSLSSGLASHALTELNVSDNALGLAGIQSLKEVLKSQRTLTRLFCNNDGLQADAVNLITQLLLDPQETGTQGTSTLKTFEIFNNMLGAAGGHALAPLLAASPHLEHLRISTNRIGEPAAGLAIANALSQHTSFISLTLCDNTFGIDAAKSLAKGVLSHVPHLLHLNLSDLGLVDEDNEDYSGLIAVIQALRKTAPLLQTLDLQSSGITPRVARHLAKTLRHKHELRILNLEGNEIKSSGAIAIVEALQHHQHLKEINLMQNQISSRTTDVIARILCTKPSLTSLQLNRNAFSSESIAQIEKALADAENENDGVLGSWSDNDEEEEEEEDQDEQDEEDEEEEEEEEHADVEVDKLAAELEKKSKV